MESSTRQVRRSPWGRAGVWTITAALALGCSAIIAPDTSRLGGDGGAAGVDAGPRPGDDAGPGPGRDGGPRPGEDAGPGAPDGGPTPTDAGPSCAGGCDDGIACTEDACLGGACRHVPDDGACPDGQRCSATLGCVAQTCTSDAECDDGADCTVDRCRPDGTCASQAVDNRCRDAFDCTGERCAPTDGASDARGCVIEPDDARCGASFCAAALCDPSAGCVAGPPPDCDDRDPCTADGCDDGAEACVHVPRDDDGDGFAAAFVPDGDGTRACGGPDCDDRAPDVHPGAMERCDGVDNDCDGVIDDGCVAPPDTCADAAEIVLSDAGGGSARGIFAALADDYDTNPICGAARRGGADAVYYVDLPRGTWDLEVQTTGSAANTVLGLGFDCSPDGLGIICNDDMQRGTTASRVWVHRAIVATGSGVRVYLLVDAYDSGETGDYVVNVRRTPAAADACPSSFSGPPLDISGGGTVVGFQPRDFGTERGSCQGPAEVGGEAVFALGATSGTIDLEAYSVDFLPDLYVRRGTCGGGELVCASGIDLGGIGAASVRESVTSGSDFFVFLDGGQGSYALYYRPF